MAKVYINKEDIKSIVDSFKMENDTFVVRSYIDGGSKKTCHFYLNGKECKIEIYIKKDCVNLIPLGKNVDESNLLIKYISSKGFSTDVKTKQVVFPCSKEVVNLLVNYIEDECNGIVSCSQKQNPYKFVGYNGDVLTFTFYKTTNNAMIQGKPFQAYSVVTTFLSCLPDYTFDEIVTINNTFVGMNTPSSSVRLDMQNKLGNAYNYLDEALLKSISGSLTLLKQKASSEDYTGCVTGEFKALEGYLKKILSTKYSYRLKKSNTFCMFHRENSNNSEIDSNTQIPSDERIELNKIYSMYSNKRNIYLHATIDPSQTRIIETIKEAQDISEMILKTIKNSHEVLFKNLL